MGKVLPISLNLNFTPNTLDCYGLITPYSSDSTRWTIKLLVIAELGPCRAHFIFGSKYSWTKNKGSEQKSMPYS